MSKFKKFTNAVHDVLSSLYNALYGFTFNLFKSLNQKVRSKLPVWRMEEETLEHVRSSVRVFKHVILPLSLLYVFVLFYFFGENALDSMFWGIWVFFYSNFLQTFPSSIERKPETRRLKTCHVIKSTPFCYSRRSWFGLFFLGCG